MSKMCKINISLLFRAIKNFLKTQQKTLRRGTERWDRGLFHYVHFFKILNVCGTRWPSGQGDGLLKY